MSCHVLVVEDDLFLAEALSDGLSLMGVRARAATTAGDAADAVRLVDPCVILLDLGIADDFLTLARGVSGGACAPILLMSGDHRRVASNAGRLGATAVLRKPFALADATGLVRRFCRSAHAAPEGGTARPPSRYRPPVARCHRATS